MPIFLNTIFARLLYFMIAKTKKKLIRRSAFSFIGLHGMLITILLFVEYLEVRVNLADTHVTSLVVLDQVEYLTGQHQQNE